MHTGNPWHPCVPPKRPRSSAPSSGKGGKESGQTIALPARWWRLKPDQHPPVATGATTHGVKIASDISMMQKRGANALINCVAKRRVGWLAGARLSWVPGRVARVLASSSGILFLCARRSKAAAVVRCGTHDSCQHIRWWILGLQIVQAKHCIVAPLVGSFSEAIRAVQSRGEPGRTVLLLRPVGNDSRRRSRHGTSRNKGSHA